MKKFVSLFLAVMLLFTMAPAVFAEGEAEIAVTVKHALQCDITDVVLTVPEGLTNVEVVVGDVPVTDFVYSGTTITFDASKYTTIKETTVSVSSDQGSKSSYVNLCSFADYMTENNFSYYGNSKIDFSKDYFGQYAMTNSSNGTNMKREIDTTNDVLLMYAAAAAPSESVWVRATRLPAAISGASDAAADTIGRYVDLYFYFDAKTEDTASKLALADTGGFSLGTNIFSTNGKFAATDISYEAKKMYTFKAHLDSIDGLFEVFVKETGADDSAYQVIYTRTQDLVGPNFKSFGLSGYASTATTKFTIDNMYYKGYVSQPNGVYFAYLNNGEATYSREVPVSATALRVDLAGNNIGAIENIYVKNSSGEKVVAANTAEELEGRANARVTIPTGSLEEGEYKLIVGKGTQVDKVGISADVVIPFSVRATEFVFTSPVQNEKIPAGKEIELSAVAPGASKVVFDLSGTKYEGVKVGNTSRFAVNASAITEVGTYGCEVESFDAEGNSLNFEKVYFDILKSSDIIVNKTTTSWVQKSGGNTSGGNQNLVRAHNELKDSVDSGNNGFKMYYGTGTYDKNTYLYMQEGTTFGYTGKLAMYVDAKVDTTCDTVSLQIYGNKTSLNMASGGGRETVEVYPALFNSNGCFHNTSEVYEAGKWYEIKIVFDLDKDTKALYVDGKFLKEESLGGNYLCVGSPVIRLNQSTVADRTVYAGVSIDNWGFASELDYPAIKSVFVDSAPLNDSMIIANNAAQVNVELSRPLVDTAAVKAYVNGVLSDAITETLQTSVALSDSSVAGYNNVVFTIPAGLLKTGDKVSFAVESGAGFVSALKVSGANTTAVTLTATEDSAVELLVGDENKVYYTLDEIQVGDKYISVIKTVNESGAKVPVMALLTAYTNSANTRMRAVAGSTEAEIEKGEAVIRITLDKSNDDKTVSAFLWTRDLMPLASVTKSLAE